MNAHKFLLWWIVSAIANPIILYCSLLINKDFTSITKCICLLSTSTGEAYAHICKFLISQHFSCCTCLSTSKINDQLHPLHPCLSNALSTLDLLLNSFDVELLFLETLSSLAWPVVLQTRITKSIYYLPIFPKEYCLLSYHLQKIYDFFMN